ncbi:MAG TPA: FecR domain-containing protein [Spirochaetia bacterium]|nr:FecR domain-containing protein [Spirochaetia bacterium]
MFLLLSPGLWAENAVFKDVKGKVEYLDGTDWLPAKVGLSIPSGTTISTGFKSTAALEVMGSVLFVKPLTRMVLASLVRDAQGTKTDLTLLAGKVRAEVKPTSETAKTQFEVKGPEATASVRGTGFEFDGVNLLVNHGEVRFANRWNVSRSIQGGEFSSIGRGTSVTPPVAVKPAEKPLITAGGGAAEVDQMFAPGPETPTGPGGAVAAVTPTYDLSTVINTFGDELLLDKTIVSVTDQVNNTKNTVIANNTAPATVDTAITVK